MKKLVTIAVSLVLLVQLCITGCVWSENPVNAPSPISIKINSPHSNDTIGYKNKLIDFSVVQNKGIKFFQLFINGKFVSDIIPLNGEIPSINLPLDSAMIGKRISFYICYYDKDNASAYSDSVVNVLIAENHEPPFKPYNFSLKSIADNLYNISWKDSSGNNTWFEIFRRSASGSYTDNPYITAKPGSYNINDENTEKGVAYYYKIRSANLYGSSAFTEEINTLGGGGSLNVPAPSGLQAKAVAPKVVKLSWVDNSINENYFEIERRTNYTNFISIGYVSKNVTIYTDSSTNLAAGGEYYYRVKAYSSSDSSWSSEVHVQTPSYLLLPPVITSLTNITSNSVLIKWGPGNSQYPDWQIYRRSEEESQFSLIAEVEGYMRQYTDLNILPDKKYYYKMLAKDANYISDFSRESNINTIVIPLISPKFTLYYYAGGNKIYLAWEFGQSASKFIIERKDLSVSPAAITLIEVNGTLLTYEDIVIAACDKNFEYRIKAVDEYTSSDFSTSITIKGGCW